MELDAEGFAQRLKHLDDSEQRYKDENWNLETQLQELQAASREASSRENKLQQALGATNSEKTGAQRELDDLKQNHGKVTEEYALLRKHHESELAGLRKNVNMGESEKSTMQRKIDELTSQNQELARGIAHGFRNQEAAALADREFPLDEDSLILSEREASPPPSPTKGGQRHSMLESETLKSSLNHAHRMIQSLKGNVHREKSEKNDLKRMLQEARDELEIQRAEPGEKRARSKSQRDKMRRGQAGLGAARSSRTDVLIDPMLNDPDWEDNADSPAGGIGARPPIPARGLRATTIVDSSDAYQTANETEGFETANERDSTDNDAFQTGAESMASGSSDELTETEGLARVETVRGKKPSPLTLAKPGNRNSLQSTASTSDDDDDQMVQTPIQGQPQRFKLKMNRNSRRSRTGSGIIDSNPSTAKNSPASFTNGPGDLGQSLAAELEGISGDEDGTPSKGNISSPRSTNSLRRDVSDKRSSASLRKGSSYGSQPGTPGMRPSTVIYNDAPPVPRIPMVDSGMMTEPMEPTQLAGVQGSPNSVSSGTLPKTAAASITNRIFGSSPSTPQTKRLSQVAGEDIPGSTSTSTSTPPRPVWDQPLQMLSGKIPGMGQSATSTPLSSRTTSHALDAPPEQRSLDEQRLHEVSDDLAKGSPSTTQEDARLAQLSLSPIRSLETTPVQPEQDTKPKAAAGAAATTSEHPPTESGSGSILGSVFGWRRSTSKSTPAPQIGEDETSREALPATTTENKDGKIPLGEVPANVVAKSPQSIQPVEAQKKPEPVYNADEGSQTVLSSEQIEKMLAAKHAPAAIAPTPASMQPLASIGAVSPPLPSQQSFKQPEVRVPEGSGAAPAQSYRDLLGKSVKRPTSVSSMRSRTAQYPPLPPDHQEAIAAAAEKSTTNMGPPLAPASAYPSGSARSRRGSRPQTPSQQGYPSPSSKGGTTPRAGRYSTTRGQVSRRSSVSSFASELDQRFNIRTDGMPMPEGFSSNTDPRMIQAITQTMIGEMMWKYTRKAGRGEMSKTRHPRFFWVHPYTRTLYWSDRDPASANRAELKSKSVAIEAVRVVTDDNPMPPGLHRKSLIIVTPGRSVKFTAQTSQRHATWFNALSYLLLRTGADGLVTNNAAGDFTDADVDEFNPQVGGNRRSARSRISMSSFKSNATANRNLQSSLSSRVPINSLSGRPQTMPQTIESEDEKPTGSIRKRISRSLSRKGSSRNSSGKQPEQTDTALNSVRPSAATGGTTASRRSSNAAQHASIGSRISNYWKPTDPALPIRDSVRSRGSRAESIVEPGVLEGGRSVISANVVNDSAEDLRRVIEDREERGTLENVRACCDGEFAPDRQ